MAQAEANIQAEFYHLCRLANIPVELELVTPVGRLDAVILSPDLTRILAIVECKRSAILSRKSQLRRYRAIGARVYELFSKTDAPALLARIISEILGYPGIPIACLDLQTATIAQARSEYLAERRNRKIDRWNENLIIRG